MNIGEEREDDGDGDDGLRCRPLWLRSRILVARCQIYEDILGIFVYLQIAIFEQP